MIVSRAVALGCSAAAAKRLAFGGWKSRISTTRWADCVHILRPMESRAEMGILTEHESKQIAIIVV